MAMQAERAKVLEMLAAGTVTVEQATQLLDAIGWEAPEGRGRPGRQPAGPVPGFTTDELVALADNGVDASYLREAWAAGFRHLTADELIELHDHGVGADYLQELGRSGLTDLSVEDVTELADHGVSVAYLRELREAGLGHLSAEQVTELHDHGVSAAFMRELGGARAAGAPGGGAGSPPGDEPGA
jgi:hypothetical protein